MTNTFARACLAGSLSLICYFLLFGWFLFVITFFDDILLLVFSSQVVTPLYI